MFSNQNNENVTVYASRYETHSTRLKGLLYFLLFFTAAFVVGVPVAWTVIYPKKTGREPTAAAFVQGVQDAAALSPAEQWEVLKQVYQRSRDRRQSNP